MPIVLGAAGLGFVLLVWLAVALGQRPPAVERDSIWTGTVTRGELLHEVVGSGQLVATEVRAVTNRAAGVVERVHLLPGARVAPDDVVLDMVSPQIDEDLAAARWELAELRAQQKLDRAESQNRRLDLEAEVAAAEADYLATAMEYEAQQQLGEGQVYSSLEVERTRLRAEQQKKRLEAVRARLVRYDDVQQAELEAADARLSALDDRVRRLESLRDALQVRAGMSGVVLEVEPEEGQQLSAGTAVARIVNPERLIARVSVDERAAAQVRPDMPAVLELGRERLAARVTRIDPAVANRMVEVDLEFDAPDPALELRPDLSVTARIEIERIDSVLKVDRPVGWREGSGPLRLFRLNPSGDRARGVEVVLGRASLREVEVRSGLAVGDRVILADMSAWLEHDTIRIR